MAPSRASRQVIGLRSEGAEDNEIRVNTPVRNNLMGKGSQPHRALDDANLTGKNLGCGLCRRSLRAFGTVAHVYTLDA